MNGREQGKEEQPMEGSAPKPSFDSLKHEEGKRPGFLERLYAAVAPLLNSAFPRQRPKQEWEHVYVTRNGTRYVDVKELLEDEGVQELICKAAKVKVESPSRNASAERRPEDGGGH